MLMQEVMFITQLRELKKDLVELCKCMLTKEKKFLLFIQEKLLLL